MIQKNIQFLEKLFRNFLVFEPNQETTKFVIEHFLAIANKDIADDVETRFDISNYELQRNSVDKPLPKGRKIRKQLD